MFVPDATSDDDEDTQVQEAVNNMMLAAAERVRLPLTRDNMIAIPVDAEPTFGEDLSDFIFQYSVNTVMSVLPLPVPFPAYDDLRTMVCLPCVHGCTCLLPMPKPSCDVHRPTTWTLPCFAPRESHAAYSPSRSDSKGDCGHPKDFFVFLWNFGVRTCIIPLFFLCWSVLIERWKLSV